jgi:DNA-binding NtrC family response regulator
VELLLVAKQIPPVDALLIERVIAQHDAAIKHVDSYKGAVEVLAKHRHAIVIIYCFNGKDDFETAEAVRIMKEVQPDLMVIAISRETAIETERQLRMSGLYFHLTSPIEQTEFEEVITGAIAKDIARREQ